MDKETKETLLEGKAIFIVAIGSSVIAGSVALIAIVFIGLCRMAAAYFGLI